jgi:hypothetical protein
MGSYLKIRQISDILPTMTRSFTDTLRQAVRNDGRTRYAIAKETGIDHAMLSRFVRGQAGMSLHSIDRLMECLGPEIRSRRCKRKEG